MSLPNPHDVKVYGNREPSSSNATSNAGLIDALLNGNGGVGKCTCETCMARRNAAEEIQRLELDLAAMTKWHDEAVDEWEKWKERAEKAASVQSASVRRFEEKPVAWLIERPKGTGKQQTTELEVVLSPLTDDTFMDEGDSAYPLFREVYTQEGIDAAKAEAARLIKGLKIE